MATGLSKYQHINNAILKLVCQLYTDREFEQLSDIGITFDTAEKLVKQDQLVTNRLTNYKSPLMQLAVNDAQISNLVEHLEKETTKDRLINNMIINGAPSEMMISNWGMDSTEYFTRKKSLDLKYNTGPGRLPKSLRKKDGNRITHYMKVYQQSMKNNPDEDPGWRLLDASVATEVPLHLAWVYMKEHLGNTDIGNDTWTDLMSKPVLL